MKIQLFDGGESSRKEPQYILQNEAVLFNNIDNERSSLKAVATSVVSAFNTQRFATYYNAQAQFVSSATRRDYVEFQKTLYYTDGIGAAKKFDGTTENNLGIIAPAVAPATTTALADDVPRQVRVTASVGGNLPNEETFYRLVNFDGTYYSKPYDFSYDPASSVGESSITDSSLFGKLTLQAADAVLTTTSGTTTILVEPLEQKNSDLYRLYLGKWYKVHNLPASGPYPADSVYDISGNKELVESEIAPVAGTMQYVYTYYNSSDGTESAPSPLSTELVTLGAVTVTMAVSADPQVDKKRIYRIGGNVTTLSLVVEVTNATTVYIDALGDTEIVGTVLTAQTNDAPPAGLAFLAEAYAMLFGVDDTKLRFTPIGQPDSWPLLNFLQFDAPITGLAAVTNGLIVFTQFRSFIVLGTAPTKLSQQSLDGSQGCVGMASVRQLAGAAIWASSDGLCVSNGNNVQVISRDKLGKIALNPVDSAIHDDVYYLLEANGNILAYDYRYAQIFKRFTLDIDSLVVGTDILYGHKDGVLQELFAASTSEQLSYLSPKFIEGRITEEKTYNKIYIFSKGVIIINILINDVQVAVKTLSGTKSHTVKIPQDKQRGNYIQFGITGTGEVLELEYVVGRGHGHG